MVFVFLELALGTSLDHHPCMEFNSCYVFSDHTVLVHSVFDSKKIQTHYSACFNSNFDKHCWD